MEVKLGRKTKYIEPITFGFDEVLKAIADENIPQKDFTAHPFIKWVGGKRSIINELISRVPSSYDGYYEPFLGGGALYFALKPEKAYLSDINFYLIVTYRAIRDNPKQVLERLKEHKSKHNLAYYRNARIDLSKEQSPIIIASLFIYLNKTCYNGLYRVNKSGLFNVPMGKYADPAIVDENNIMACSKALLSAEILQHDFSQITPKKNQFFYLDPPYHETYSSYDGSGFNSKDHEKLAEFCHKIHNNGGLFMLSNSDTEFVRSLYRNYNIETVSASRFVSCKANERNKQNELIIRNYNGRYVR